MTAEALAVWCGEVAAGFRGHEHHTQGPLRRDRDTALVALDGDPATADVAEGIDRRRAGQEPS